MKEMVGTVAETDTSNGVITNIEVWPHLIVEGVHMSPAYMVLNLIPSDEIGDNGEEVLDVVRVRVHKSMKLAQIDFNCRIKPAFTH